MQIFNAIKHNLYLLNRLKLESKGRILRLQ